MKNLFGQIFYGATVASYVLLFLEPSHSYAPYAKNVIVFYEILSWIIFTIFSFITISVFFGRIDSSIEVANKFSNEKNMKMLEKLNKPGIRFYLARASNYALIVFVGIFVGDYSMATILFLNALVFVYFRNLMMSIYKEILDGNQV